MRSAVRLLLLLAVLTGLAACACPKPAGAAGAGSAGPAVSESVLSQSPLSESGQLLLVLSENWDATSGELRAFERDGSGWKPVAGPLGGSVPVSLGRTGLAWGAGLHGGNPSSVASVGGGAKREGDGRAPAGLFLIGEGFAYEPGEAGAAKLPILRADADLICVDDVKSRHYNALVRKAATQADWDSVEDMLRKDQQYSFGALVRHNMDPVRTGGGSCIFLHVWKAPGAPTSGCTAMAQEHMLGLLRWLDAGKRPALAQLPRDEYLRLRAAWGLPDIAGR